MTNTMTNTFLISFYSTFQVAKFFISASLPLLVVLQFISNRSFCLVECCKPFLVYSLLRAADCKLGKIFDVRFHQI